MQQPGNFMVPVALHVVQKKDGAIALRQFADRTSQRNAVDCSPQAAIVLTEINLFCLFVRRVGALVVLVAVQLSVPGLYRPPVLEQQKVLNSPPQTII